ncbi:MAG TPA: hypothetical protein DIC24_09775, partial [Gammaproteobacteria bacterium]|nr:hypothetical protein [Gammaproteobacteria bacterium]
MFASTAALFERQFALEALMSSYTASRLSRWLIILSCCFATMSLKAADELLVYAFSAEGPVDGAVVAIDQIPVGQTAADGSLLTDLSGSGVRTLTITADGREVTTRVSAASGQLVDAVAQLEENTVYVDVYSQVESVADRNAAAEGTLTISVIQGGAP